MNQSAGHARCLASRWVTRSRLIERRQPIDFFLLYLANFGPDHLLPLSIYNKRALLKYLCNSLGPLCTSTNVLICIFLYMLIKYRK